MKEVTTLPNRKYYIRGNTADGLVNLLDTNIVGLKKVIILNHVSSALKSKVIRYLLKKIDDTNSEILMSPLGNDYLDGIILRGRSLAVLDGTIARSGTTVDLDEFQKINSPTYKSKIETHTKSAYNCFKTGLALHDNLEKIYIGQMDFERADAFADEFINDLLGSVSKRNHNSYMFQRFFGTNTPDGVVNEVPYIISSISNVYYIKGRAGTGKSTFMKKIAKACADHGYDIELYYCSFDPSSIDMVLVRDLDFCIFDSTDPHEFFPKREGEVNVDLYKELVVPGTDEKFETQINDWNSRYKAYMKEGIQHLKKAGEYLDARERKFMTEITDADIQKAAEQILKKYIH